MIYVVGCLRSGTQSIASITKGAREPHPKIVEEALTFYRGDYTFLSRLKEKLRTRKELDVPLISDHHQSYVIQIIKEVDPDAEFIVLLRRPHDVMKSLMARRWYRPDQWFHLRPRQGWSGQQWTQLLKVGWLWTETYRVILRELDGTPFRLVATENLTEVCDATPNLPDFPHMNMEERDYWASKVTPLWTHLRTRPEFEDCTFQL